jgi:hypothetical protein
MPAQTHCLPQLSHHASDLNGQGAIILKMALMKVSYFIGLPCLTLTQLQERHGSGSQSATTESNVLVEGSIYDQQMLWLQDPLLLDVFAPAGQSMTGYSFSATEGPLLDLPQLLGLPDVGETLPVLSQTQCTTPSFGTEDSSEELRSKFVPKLEGDDQLYRLLDLQIKLLGLFKSLSTGQEHKTRVINAYSPKPLGFNTESDLSKDIEEIYRVTEDFAKIIESLYQSKEAEHSTELNLSIPTPNSLPGTDESRTEAAFYSPQPHVATVLLFSSCYVRLMHVYELLIETLQERSQQHNKEGSSRLARSTGSPASNRSAFHLPRGDVPSFRIGTLQLAMPANTNVELHFYVIAQMIQRLKNTMELGMSRTRTIQNNKAAAAGARDGERGGGDNVGLGAKEGWTSPGNKSSVFGMVEMVLPEVSEREEILMAIVHTAKSSTIS